jgi:hypothetical protein
MDTGGTEFCTQQRNRLIACSLGHNDPDLERHLEGCSVCRAEVEHYRALLASTRAALSSQPPDVFLVTCRRVELSDRIQCIAEDVEHNLAVILAAQDSTLHGQIVGCGLGCTCWQESVVRLFGSGGFVVSSPVDSSGAFVLHGLRPGQRYTVAIVSTEGDRPQLRIIGEFLP